MNNQENDVATKINIPDFKEIEALKIQGFCRGVAEIEWLVIVTTLLYLFVTDGATGIPGPVVIAVVSYFAFSLLIDRLGRYWRHRPWVFALRIAAMIAFTTWFLHQTGSVLDNPLDALYVLPIITSALTLGKLPTVLNVALVAACYLWLIAQHLSMGALNAMAFSVVASHLAIFLLTGYLTTVLGQALLLSHAQTLELGHRELEASANMQRMQHVVEHSTYAFIEIDAGGRITQWNHSATEMLGWAREQALGAYITDLIVPQKYRGNYLNGLKAFLETGQSNDFGRPLELNAQHKDGQILPVEAVIHPIRMGEEWYFIAFVTDISERRSEHRTLKKRAYTDAVTGLANRHAFEEQLHAVLHGEHSNSVALLLIDMDDFKIINDRYGHDVGDELLWATGRRLTQQVRKDDLVARLGGDEFVILMEETPRTTEQMQQLGNQLIKSLAQPFSIYEHTLTLSASLGIAVTDDPYLNGKKLLRCADHAMYEAKGAGKNQFHIDTAYGAHEESGQHELMLGLNADRH